MKLDILAFGAHPDDVELSASGTLLRHRDAGYSIGIVDLTEGELGTRGTVDDRRREAARASEILGLDVRENLGMADGFFEVNRENQLKVIEVIRAYQPRIVLCNAISDRHIDHGRASRLVSESCFLAGLRKISTRRNGEEQEVWRPEAVYHYIQDRHIKPDVVVDISGYWEKKKSCILAFSTQFYNPESPEPSTPISSLDFLDFMEGRARDMGRSAGFSHGEGFTVERVPGVKDLFQLL